MAIDKVASVTIPGGHFLPMTNMEGTAEAIAPWLQKQINTYHENKAEVFDSWTRKDLASKQKLGASVEQTLKRWDGKPWVKPEISSEKSRV